MKKNTELKAGIFVAVTLSLFLLGMFTLGRERQLFARQEKFRVTFEDVKGLSEGAPVRLGGIAVGRVDEIDFSEKLDDPRVHVVLLINEDYLERIRSDTFVSIETQGLLGDKFISLSSGSNPQRVMPGGSLKSKDLGDIAEVLTKAGQVVDNTAEISQNVNDFLAEFKEESLDDLQATLKSFKKIVQEIESGEGLTHRLIYSKKDGQEILDSLSSASKDLESIFKEIESGSGLLNALVYDPKGKKAVQSLIAASDNLALTAESINKISAEIISGEGLLHDLIYQKSPEGVDEIVAKLNRTASNFEAASRALARGEGTIGALLVDSGLYDNLVEVTDGAKRSVILRHAIRSSLEESEAAQ